MEEVKITILCENTTIHPFNTIAEWGFSAYIETKEGNFLFDTGQGLGIINNAKQLKVDLENIEGIIISHGHFDHTGGLKKVLEIAKNKRIWCHPNIFKPRYHIVNTRYIGSPFSKEELEKLGAKFEFIKDFTKINNYIYLTGEVPRNNNIEKLEKDLVILENKEYKPDPLEDDISLVIKSKNGVSLILGCAHAGVINILEYTASKLNVNEFYSIIGGTHLLNADENRIKGTIKTLEKYKIKEIGVSHCTGFKKACILYNYFKNKFFICNVGTQIKI